MYSTREPRRVDRRGTPTPLPSGMASDRLVMVIPTWILLLDSTRKVSNESFELLELRGDDLGADFALQAGVEGIFAYGEGLVEDALAGHASSGVQGAVWVGR